MGAAWAWRSVESVPMPMSAVTTSGSDSQVTVYQASTDTLWDFWQAYKDGDGWHACWGGRIDNVSQDVGHFPKWFGASASGLAHEAGAVSIADVKSGRIEHAVSLELPVANVSSLVSWPAQRSDGTSTATSAIPEGGRLRLDPDVDVDGLDMTPIGKMVAKAAQRYGFLVTDRAGAVAVKAESPDAARLLTGSDPWISLLRGKQAYQVLDGFPWQRLKVLEPHYGRPQ